MKLKAKIYKVDVPNSNNIIYTASELASAVNEYNKKPRIVPFSNYNVDAKNVPVGNNIGKARLEFDGEYVTAYVDVFESKLDFLHTKLVILENNNVKIMPISTAAQKNNSIQNMNIYCIILTVDILDFGKIESGMFTAEIIQ